MPCGCLEGDNDEELCEERHPDDGSAIKRTSKMASDEMVRKKRKLDLNRAGHVESSDGVTCTDVDMGSSPDRNALQTLRDSKDDQKIEAPTQVLKGISDDATSGSPKRRSMDGVIDINEKDSSEEGHYDDGSAIDQIFKSASNGVVQKMLKLKQIGIAESNAESNGVCMNGKTSDSSKRRAPETRRDSEDGQQVEEAPTQMLKGTSEEKTDETCKDHPKRVRITSVASPQNTGSVRGLQALRDGRHGELHSSSMTPLKAQPMWPLLWPPLPVLMPQPPPLVFPALFSNQLQQTAPGFHSASGAPSAVRPHSPPHPQQEKGNLPQKAAHKKAAHIKWSGKTIALGTFPIAEAAEKMAQAKALTRRFRHMYPKPSREWVIRELERWQIRVLRARRSTASSEETEEGDGGRSLSYQNFVVNRCSKGSKHVEAPSRVLNGPSEEATNESPKKAPATGSASHQNAGSEGLQALTEERCGERDGQSDVPPYGEGNLHGKTSGRPHKGAPHTQSDSKDAQQIEVPTQLLVMTNESPKQASTTSTASPQNAGGLKDGQVLTDGRHGSLPKKSVHVKWWGKTIALGTFPIAEADEKCARAKALTRTWRSTMVPKPSRSWVIGELERQQIRVVATTREEKEEGDRRGLFSYHEYFNRFCKDNKQFEAPTQAFRLKGASEETTNEIPNEEPLEKGYQWTDAERCNKDGSQMEAQSQVFGLEGISEETTNESTKKVPTTSAVSPQNAGSAREIQAQPGWRYQCSARRGDVTNWEAMYDCLLQYRNRHGHTNVPPYEKGNSLLKNPIQGEERRKRASIQWFGDTIKLGTFPSAAEAQEKLALAKNLIYVWGVARFPTPSTEWVIQELERLQIRVVTGNTASSGERKGGDRRESDDEQGDERTLEDLSRWVQLQRLWYQSLMKNNPSFLTQDRIDKLNKVDFDFSPVGGEHKPWERWLESLRVYKEEHGDFDGVLLDKEVGEWVSTQLKQYHRLSAGKLSPMTGERLAKLIEIGLFPMIGNEWEQEEESTEPDEGLHEEGKGGGTKRTSGYTHLTWDQWFNLLRDFKEANGHLQVPSKPTSGLYNWIKKQREEHNKLRKGKPSKLTALNLERLRDLGYLFPSKAPNKPWDDRVAELRKFAEEHGHCCVPKSCYPDLGLFVSRMRTYYNLRKIGKPSCGLTEERVKVLESIGMVWRMRDKHKRRQSVFKPWEEWYQQLIRFRALHGHCRVPCKTSALGQFVRTQRKAYKDLKEGQKSSLTPDRLIKLTEIGFAFQVGPQKKFSKEEGLRRAAARAAAWRQKMELHNEEEDDEDQTEESAEPEASGCLDSY